MNIINILMVETFDEWYKNYSYFLRALDPQCVISRIKSWKEIFGEIKKSPTDLLLISGKQVIDIRYEWPSVIEEINKANGRKVMIVIVSSFPKTFFDGIQKDNFLSRKLSPEEMKEKLTEILQKLNAINNKQTVSEKI